MSEVVEVLEVVWPKVVLEAFGSTQAASDAWEGAKRRARGSKYWGHFGDKGGRYALVGGRLFAGVETQIIRAPRARIVAAWARGGGLALETWGQGVGYRADGQDLAQLGEGDNARAVLVIEGGRMLWLPVVCVE